MARVPELVRLAGSLLSVGFPGDGIDDALLADIRALGPGGLLLFARNVSDVARTRALVDAVVAAAGGDVPALVCVDQEGGRVARLRFGGELPSLLTLGAANDVTLAERAGARLAQELRAVGATVDFAPVLDLALAPQGTVIGTRSLGDDPARVARLGAALVRGLQSGGVAATVKHFPGHGATDDDSHVALPYLTLDAATLRARDLEPFRVAFAANAYAVMTAHVVVAAIDPGRPATLSPKILIDLLRNKMGFEGVCFTDCLQMDAIARGVGTLRGAVAALAAGADSLVVSNDLALARSVRDAIVDAVRLGSLPRERLEEAAARVAALRRTVAPQLGSAAVDYPTDDSLAREIARRAIVLVRGGAALRAELPVTVISFEGDSADGIAAWRGERPSLSLALRRRKIRSEMLRVEPSPDEAMRDMLVQVLRAQGPRNVIVVARRAHLFEGQRRAIDAIVDVAPAMIAVSALEPFDVPALARAQTVLCSFGDDEPNVEALADVLTGRCDACGSMPISLAEVSV